LTSEQIPGLQEGLYVNGAIKISVGVATCNLFLLSDAVHILFCIMLLFVLC